MTSLTIQHVENGYLVTQWAKRNEAGCCGESQSHPLYVYTNITDLCNDLGKLLDDAKEKTP